MTIEEAKQKLIVYRDRQRVLRKKIDRLREFLRDSGIEPDPPPVDLTQRNNSIYSRRLDGLSWDEIAAEYKLSKQRVKDIYARVEKINERKARKEQEESSEE